MRRISKTGNILACNSGETIVEVLVAFTLLSIVMLMFSQGIAFATNAEFRANRTRENADEALRRVQCRLASGERDETFLQILGKFADRVKIETYSETIDGQTYVFVRYDVSPLEPVEG